MRQFYVQSHITTTIRLAAAFYSVYKAYEELEADFVSGALHPGDLKAALTVAINRCMPVQREVLANPKCSSFARVNTTALSMSSQLLRRILDPVRKQFASGEPAKLLEQVKKYRVTR